MLGTFFPVLSRLITQSCLLFCLVMLLNHMEIVQLTTRVVSKIKFDTLIANGTSLTKRNMLSERLSKLRNK